MIVDGKDLQPKYRRTFEQVYMSDHSKTVVAGDVKLDPEDELRQKRTAGSLTYSKAGLVSLFGWLLWGGVCFQLMEAVLTTLLPLQLRAIGATNQQMALMMTTEPAPVRWSPR